MSDPGEYELSVPLDGAAAMIAADAASNSLGIAVETTAPGCAVARMVIGPLMINGHGIAHGGYMFLLADTAFAVACNSIAAPSVARMCEIAFVQPVREGDVLIASAKRRAPWGRGGIYDVTIARADGEVVAEFRGYSAPLRSENPR